MNLNQVTVPSIDLEKSIKFYEMLGLELIVKALPHYARFKCPDGNSTFSLHLANDSPKGEGIWVYFECENLDNKVEDLKSKGLKFDLEPTDHSYSQN